MIVVDLSIRPIFTEGLQSVCYKRRLVCIPGLSSSITVVTTTNSKGESGGTTGVEISPTNY